MKEDSNIITHWIIEVFLIISSLLMLSSCQDHEIQSRIEGYTEINLKFPDYDPDEHKGFIDIKIENGIRPFQEQLKISDSGLASYSFINDRKREMILNYQNREINLIVSPNDLINAELQITEIVDLGSELEASTITSGSEKRTNNLILHSTKWLDSLIGFAPMGIKQDGRTEEMKFKEERLAFLKSQIEAFRKYVLQNGITDETYINWGNAQIRHSAARYLNMYPFNGKYNTEIVETSEYFDFNKDLTRAVGDEEFAYISYQDYLEMYTSTFLIIANISDRYAAKREQLKNDSLSIFPIVFNMVKKLPDQKTREYVMAYTYKMSPNIPESYEDSLEYYVSSELKEQLQTMKPKETATIVSLLHEYDIAENEKDELIDIYSSLKGKVIYHDFWFATCQPCIMEMPHYNELMSSLNSDEVEFLFFGVYMENEDWIKAIEKHNLGGKHHLLTQNQLAFFQKYFGVRGYPHHHIVGPNGVIGEKVPFQTFPSNFDAIKKRINRFNGIQP